MDNAAVRRRNYNKGNKENAEPAYGSKPFIKNTDMSVAPLQLKSNKKDEIIPKKGLLKATTKQTDTKVIPGEKKEKTVQRNGQQAVPTVKRQTHSQAFLSERAVKDKKIVTEAPKPAAAVPSSKPTPGMYKGKIVQSKIGSIWKSSATVMRAESKTSGPKPDSQKCGNVRRTRSKSSADPPGHGTQKPPQKRSKSTFDRPAHMCKSAATSHPPTVSVSSHPLSKTVPATQTNPSHRNTKVVYAKATGTQSSKSNLPGTEKKAIKPPVSSTLSQYRFTVETAEERRGKLAEWLASKGKTLKRPTMSTTSKTKVSANPKSDLKPQPEPATQCEIQPNEEAHETEAAAAATTHSADKPGTEIMTLNLSPDPPLEPQDSVDDIVVNLCDALEAMMTTSRCNNELSQVTEVSSNVEAEDDKPKDVCTKELVKNEMPEDVSKQLQVEQVKDGAEESAEQEVETDDEEAESEDDYVMATTPRMEGASVVKYSVKTTPYLQSVKKTIEHDVSTSRRKSNIKDLKFLTPVRRSCRIQRSSSHLPTMLQDHDPCISSLGELLKLDDSPNAYIYRKNPALMENLPDQPGV